MDGGREEERSKGIKHVEVLFTYHNARRVWRLGQYSAGTHGKGQMGFLARGTQHVPKLDGHNRRRTATVSGLVVRAPRPDGVSQMAYALEINLGGSRMEGAGEGKGGLPHRNST